MRKITNEGEYPSDILREYLLSLVEEYGQGLDVVLSRMEVDVGVEIETDMTLGLSLKQANEIITYLEMFNNTFRGAIRKIEHPLPPYQPAKDKDFIGLPW